MLVGLRERVNALEFVFWVMLTFEPLVLKSAQKLMLHPFGV